MSNTEQLTSSRTKAVIWSTVTCGRCDNLISGQELLKWDNVAVVTILHKSKTVDYDTIKKVAVTSHKNAGILVVKDEAVVQISFQYERFSFKTTRETLVSSHHNIEVSAASNKRVEVISTETKSRGWDARRKRSRTVNASSGHLNALRVFI